MRQPAVAGFFYPDSPENLKRDVSALFKDCNPQPEPDAKAIICPHAGYVYSGKLAAQTIAASKIPSSVVLIGPNHTGTGEPVSLSHQDWSMPGRVVPVDKELSRALLAQTSLAQIDETAHLREHSLEVQLPLLLHAQKDLQILAMTLGRLSYEDCTALGSALAQAIVKCDKKVLLFASTDMSHYESRQSATQKDNMALDALLELNPEKLFNTVLTHRITMCGFIPVVVCLIAALHLGATKAKITGYTDSGYVTGDSREVVAYAGAVVS